MFLGSIGALAPVFLGLLRFSGAILFKVAAPSMTTLREASSAEKSLAEQNKCGIKECEFGPKLTFFYSAFSKS